MKSIHHRKRAKNKVIILALVALIFAGVAYGYYAYKANSWPFQRTYPEPQEINKPTSEEDERIKDAGNLNQSTNDDSPDSGVSDLGGQGTSDSQEGDITSDSGAITLYSPTKDQLLSNGALVSGTAKTTSVSYRIKDTERGVIGQGDLTVNDGKFSGKLTIYSSASTGTFEIFSLDSEGREINRIKIPVRFG
jgi:hypothetical protein